MNMYVAAARLALASFGIVVSCTQSVPPSPTGYGAYADPTVREKSSEAPTLRSIWKELHCAGEWAPEPSSCWYSAVLATQADVLFAATRRAIRIKRAAGDAQDEDMCSVPIGCTSLVPLSSETIACIFTSPSPSRFSLTVSRDAGKSWVTTVVDTAVLYPTSAWSNHGSLEIIDSHGGLWEALIGADGLTLQQIGRAPVRRTNEVSFTSDTWICLENPEQDPHEICKRRGSRDWLEQNAPSFALGAIGRNGWWGADAGGALYYSSPLQPAWKQVPLDADVRVVELSALASEPGDVSAIIERGGNYAQYLVRFAANTSAHSLEGEIALSGLKVSALGAEGGRVAIGALDGVYVERDGSLKKVLPACYE